MSRSAIARMCSSKPPGDIDMRSSRAQWSRSEAWWVVEGECRLIIRPSPQWRTLASM